MKARVCIDCKRPMPLAEFHVNNARPGGRASSCKQCVRERWRAWAANNDRTEYRREYRKKNAAVLAEKQREYVRKNANRVKESRKQYYESHREEILVRQTAHRRKHQEIYRPIAVRASENRRAREVSAPGIITKEIYNEIMSRMPTCQKCGSKNDLQIDHIVPLVMGGANYIDNLQVLCKSCNASKGGRYIADYRKWDA